MLIPRRKRELFESTRRLWPPQLRLTDINRSGTAIGTEPPLYEVYETVTSRLPRDDHWAQVAAWSFHQALDKLGRRKFKRSQSILRPLDVSFRSFNTRMLSNLDQADWEAEREAYLALP
jgi:hypothetical protein